MRVAPPSFRPGNARERQERPERAVHDVEEDKDHEEEGDEYLYEQEEEDDDYGEEDEFYERGGKKIQIKMKIQLDGYDWRSLIMRAVATPCGVVLPVCSPLLSNSSICQGFSDSVMFVFCVKFERQCDEGL